MRTPWVWVTLVVVGTVGNCVSWGTLPVLIPLFVDRNLDGGAEVLGFVFAGYGVGGLVGTVFAGSANLRFDSIVPAYAGWMVGTVATGMLAFAPNALLAAGALALVGLFGQLAEVVWSTLLQKHVPPNLLGRVMSTDWLVSLSLQPLGVTLAAPVAAAIGLGTTLVGGAAIATAAMGLGLAFPATRRIRSAA